MSYRFTVKVCGKTIRDEIREGEPRMPDVAGFLKDMKKLGVKTTASVTVVPQDNRSKEVKDG